MSSNVTMLLIVSGLSVAAVFLVILLVSRRGAKGNGAVRGDAYFKAMFPELQPLFHPEKAISLVRDRNSRIKVVDGRRWDYPSGLEIDFAQVAIVKDREYIRLFDAAGAQLTEFEYEKQPAGGMLRIGRGKLTVTLEVDDNPRVRYWHPEREFKWSRKGGWQFTTPIAERPVDSNDSGSSFSSDRSSSSSSGYATVAAAAGTAALVSGAGGAFAGGGASEGWDDASTATDGGNAGATAY